MKRILFLIISLILISSIALAAGTSTAQFLKLGVGARAIGMGEAHSAIAEGADSVHWNPAGIASITSRDITFTHSEWIDDIRYEYAAASTELFGYGAVGISYGQLTMGELDGRDDGGNPTSNFTAGDKLVGINYGIGFYDIVQVGAGFKYVMSDIENESATAYAGDFGIMANPISRLRMGIAIQNIGSEMTFISEGDPLPRTIRGGLAFSQPLGERMSVLVATDGVKYNDIKDIYANTGVEFTAYDLIAARLGYRYKADDNKDTAGITGGVGFKYRVREYLGLRFDYAYADMGVFEATHRATFGISF